MTAEAAFEAERGRLTRLAYRMLGSLAEAEDAVQDAWLRWSRAGREEIADPAAWLARVTARLCLDRLRAAKARRETYIGPWLPEPLVEELAEDPVERAEEVSVAFLLALQRLSPLERAVFLLRDVFDYPYDRIAAIVGKSEAATRQIASRARLHVDERRPRYDSSRRRREELAERFFAAAGDGDLGTLESLLSEDVELHGDGGGRVPALARALHGRRRVVRALAAWITLGGRAGGIEFRREEVNGQPGALITDAEGALIGVWSLGIADDRIQTIRSLVNPDKLAHLGPVTGLAAMLEAARRDAG